MKVLVFCFFVSSVRTCGTSWWSKSGSQIIRTSAVSHRRVIFYTFTLLFLAVLRFSGLFLGRLVHEVQMKAERRLCVVVSASALFALLYCSSYSVFDFLRPGSYFEFEN